MTVAGAIVTMFVFPMLAGQLIYAVTRGKPAAVKGTSTPPPRGADTRSRNST